MLSATSALPDPLAARVEQICADTRALIESSERALRQRDEYRLRCAQMDATLREIEVGCDTMLLPELGVTGSFEMFVREIKRVAEAGRAS